MILGQEHEDTLSSMAMVGLAYKLRGRLDDTKELQVQVMGTSKKKLGADHPETLNSMNNLAFTLKGRGWHMRPSNLWRTVFSYVNTS